MFGGGKFNDYILPTYLDSVRIEDLDRDATARTQPINIASHATHQYKNTNEDDKICE